MTEFPTFMARDLDIGSGHTAHRHASLIDLYLHTKFHRNRRNFFVDRRTYGGHLRPTLLGRPGGVDLKLKYSTEMLLQNNIVDIHSM